MGTMEPNRQDRAGLGAQLRKWLEKDAEEWYLTRTLRKNKRLVKRLKRTNRRFLRLKQRR